jgi:SLT domain-containing protein
MAEKVGDGYIEIDTRLDETNFVKASEGMAQRAANRFGQTYNDNLAKGFREADKQFNVHVNRQISSFQSLEKQRVAAFEDSAKRLSQIQNDIAKKTEADRRISDAYQREGQRAAAAFEKEHTASFNKIAKAYTDGLNRLGDEEVDITRRTLARREVDYDRHGRRGGGILSSHISRAFDGVMSLLPSRLEFLFTRTGPIIGTTLFGAIAGGLLIGVPALGAMFTGAFVASLGLGAALGAVLVGIADDNRVLEAARRIRQTFIDNIIYHPDMQNLGQVLADQLDRVNEGLERWAPHINSILQAGARFLPGITTGLIGMVDSVLPVLDKFINSPFMTDIMNIFSHGLIVIGEAFGVSFDRFLNDPQAMEGAKKGLEDLFNLAAGFVKLTFDVARGLSRFWEFLNADPDGGGSDSSPLQKMRDIWKQIRDIIEKIASPIIEGALSTLKRIFEEMKGPLGLIVGGLEAVANWFDDEDNKNNIMTVTGLIIGLKLAMLGLHLAARAATASMSLFMAAGGFGLLGAGDKKTKLGNAGKGGAVGGLAALLLGGDAGQTAGATAGGFAGGPIGAIAGAGIGTLMGTLLSESKKKEIDREWQLLAAGNFRAYWDELKKDWGEADDNFKEVVGPVWKDFRDDLDSEFRVLGGKIDQFGEDISTRWRSVWTNFGDFFQGAWNGIVQKWDEGWARFAGIMGPWIDGIKTRWNEAWGNFKQFFIDRWNEISGFASAKWGEFTANFTTWIEGVKQRWNESWGNVKQFFIDRWNEITGFASQKWAEFSASFGTWLDGVKQRWNESWGAVKQWFIDRWNDITTFFSAKASEIASSFGTWLDGLARKWNDIWTGILGFFSGIWTSIQSGVRDGINFVIGIINKGVDIINDVLGKIGVSFRLPHLGAVVGTPQPVANMGAFSRMKTGGPVRGPGSGTADRVPALLSNGEFVVNARSTSKWFGLLSSINNGAVPRFVDGGYVGMFNWIKQRVPGVSLSSGFRPGDPGFHGKGMAIDMIFSDGSERRGGGMAALAFNMIKAAFMPIISELIWDFAGANAVWNGKNHFFTGSGAGPGTHNDHIHWAQGGAGGGGFLGGIFEWLGKGWNALVSEMLEPMKKNVFNLIPESNAMMAMGKGWVGKLMDEVIGKVKIEFDEANKLVQSSMSAAGDFSGNGLAGALRWSSTATQALKMLGLPLSWLGPLLTLIGRESGGNPNAVNRWDSNAAKGTPSMGLMQTIGPTFNAHKLPGYGNILAPLDNILAGLRYIVAQYGSIFNVQQANSRMSPAGYAKGGKFYPGQLALNETRKPEAILNQSQWDALANSSGNVDVTVMIDGVEVAHKTVVEKNNKDITQAFRRGRGVF